MLIHLLNKTAFNLTPINSNKQTHSTFLLVNEFSLVYFREYVFQQPLAVFFSGKQMPLVSLFSENFPQSPVDSQPLIEITSYNDLYVTFDSELHFKLHYVDVPSRASKMPTFFLRCSFQITNIHSLAIHSLEKIWCHSGKYITFCGGKN